MHILEIRSTAKPKSKNTIKSRLLHAAQKRPKNSVFHTRFSISERDISQIGRSSVPGHCPTCFQKILWLSSATCAVLNTKLWPLGGQKCGSLRPKPSAAGHWENRNAVHQTSPLLADSVQPHALVRMERGVAC